jgi:hypothetical protein
MSRCVSRRHVVLAAICLTLVAGLDLGLQSARSHAADVDSFCSPNRTRQSFDRVHESHGPVLVTGPGPVSTGHSPEFRVLNGTSHQIELVNERTRRWSHGRWKEMQLPVGVLSGFVVTILAPDSVSRCMKASISPKWPAGKYQWLLETRRVTDGFDKTHLLRATFHLRH